MLKSLIYKYVTEHIFKTLQGSIENENSHIHITYMRAR